MVNILLWVVVEFFDVVLMYWADWSYHLSRGDSVSHPNHHSDLIKLVTMSQVHTNNLKPVQKIQKIVLYGFN